MDQLIQDTLAGLPLVDAVTVNTYKGAGGTQLRAYLKDRGAFVYVVNQQSEAVNALLSRQTTTLEVVAPTRGEADLLYGAALLALCGTRSTPGRYTQQSATPITPEIGHATEFTVTRTVMGRSTT